MISDDQILKTLSTLKGEMCVSFDLDEVLICDPDKYPAERLPFPLNVTFPETIRKNAGLQTSALCDFGFDVWVYTGKFYSSRHVKALLGVFELDAPDDEWAEKIIERADAIRKHKFN